MYWPRVKDWFLLYFIVFLATVRETIDLILVVDISGSVGSSGLLRQRQFLRELLEQLPIGLNFVRVALVRFMGSPEVTWGLDSSFTSDFNTLITAIDSGLATTSPLATTVENALRVVLSHVIDSPGDRAEAPNVVIVIGDGYAGTDTDNLSELSEHARVLAVNVHDISTNWNSYIPACNTYDSFRYATNSGEHTWDVAQVFRTIQLLYPID